MTYYDYGQPQDCCSGTGLMLLAALAETVWFALTLIGAS